MAGKIVVLGVGNLLLQDEGIGVQVIQRLQKTHLPDYVEVVDGGTAALDILCSLEEVEKLVVVDAVRGGGAPGSIYRFHPHEVGGRYEPITSLHEIGLLEALNLAQGIVKKFPPTVIIGVEPKEIDSGLELSPEVKGKVPEIIDIILEEVRRT